MRRLSNEILSTFLVSALLLNPLAATRAFAEERPPLTFAELVANLKEAESILLKSEDLTESENYFRADDARTQAALVAAFEKLATSMDAKGNERPVAACEPLVLSRLQSALASEGIPAESAALRFALLELRKRNLLDDVALLPLLAAYPAWAISGFSEAEWTRKDPEGRVAIVECPTQTYLANVGAVKQSLGRKMKRKDIRKKIDSLAKEKNERGEPRYLSVQISWFRALEESKFEEASSFALAPVLERVKEAKNSSARADPHDKPTKVMSKKKKKSGGLSNRLALYAKYDGLQINLLADEFRVFTERMDILSAQAKIVIAYKDGRPDEIYELSPQEQYRMAAKMLHKEIEELKLSGFFSGKSPTFDDVIVAAVETGFIRAAELDAALGVDDLWNPTVSGWTKFMTVVKKYGSTALVLIPTPFSFWASLAITLAETLITKKTQGPGEADDHGISIF